MLQASSASDQQATLAFFGAVAAAWLAMCATWLALDRAFPRFWPRIEIGHSDRPRLDALLALIAALAVLGLGQLYRAGWLLPRLGAGLGWLCFNLNTLLIYAPIPLLMLARRQGPASALIDPQRWLRKVLGGTALTALGLLVYLGLRGEPGRLPAVLAASVGPAALSHFLPVCFENVAVAFLLVRLRWALGPKVALLLPCLLFALAHVPGSLERGEPWTSVVAFFSFNTLLPLVILGAVVRARDVLWLCLPHYVLDVATGAF